MYEVKMPRLGVTMQNGIITDWLVEEGEQVEKGDYLFELETEKSNLEIEAQEGGVLKKILIPPGKEVPVNTVVAVIAGADEEVDLSRYEEKETAKSSSETGTKKEKEGKAPQQQPSSPRQGGIAPRARKLAKELGIALENITGTGKDGIITEKDVREASSGETESKPSIRVKETISLTGIQKTMTTNMLHSWQNIPQFTQIVSVDMTQALAVKKELDNVSLNDIIVKAVSNAVRAYPFVNSRLENNKEVTVYEEVNVSVAVNSPDGLVVPVVRNTESKSVRDISAEVRQLVQKAENKSLSVEDYADGTITVSNLGSFGVETGTPIINSPQAAIVFAGAVKKIPIVDDNDEIKVAPIMMLSVCYDHRFIDGVKGAKFTGELKKSFENLSSDSLS